MRLSLHEVLAIAGRLDDAAGFDTPRERFRRFLLDHVTSVPVARGLLEQAQQRLSEQYQRALQDTVLAAGRLLGFETAFGVYERHGSAARAAGEWVSRRRLRVVVQVWSDQASIDVDAVTRALPVLPAPASAGDVPHVRLCVLTPACAGRAKVEQVARRLAPTTHLLSVRALLDLAELVERRSLTHDDLVRLFYPGPSLDDQVALLSRLTHPATSSAASTPAAPVTESPRVPAYWVYVARDVDATSAGTVDADANVSALEARLSVSVPAGETPRVVAGDQLVVFMPAYGSVAYATVAAVAVREDMPADGDERVYQIRVEGLTPIEPPGLVETEQRLNLELQAAVSQDPCVRVTREEFLTLLAPVS